MTTPATRLIEGLDRAAEALGKSAAQLEAARLELARIDPRAGESALLAQETADVLNRVKAEREKIRARARGSWK